MDLLVLGVLWIAWCVMHSLMIARPVTGYLQRLPGGGFRYYRLFYNITAVLTLLPLVLLTWRMRGGMVFAWQDYWQFLRLLLLATAGWLFWGGARRYDMGYFLGIRQIRSGTAHILLSETEEFSTAGVFGLTRHPWYLASILLIWSILPEYSLTDLIVSAVLSVYIIIGTFLEERKLLAEYGDAYRRYQQQVPRFLPWFK